MCMEPLKEPKENWTIYSTGIKPTMLASFAYRRYTLETCCLSKSWILICSLGLYALLVQQQVEPMAVQGSS